MDDEEFLAIETHSGKGAPASCLARRVAGHHPRQYRHALPVAAGVPAPAIGQHAALGPRWRRAQSRRPVSSGPAVQDQPLSAA